MPTVSHQIKKNGFKALNMTPNKIGPFLVPIPTQAFCLLTLPFVMLIIFRFSLFAKTCENVNKPKANAMTNGNSTTVCPNAILIPAVTPCLLP